MKTEKLRKGLSLLLAVIMLLTMMPATGIIPEAEAAYPVMKATNAASSNGYYKYYDKITSITFLDKIEVEGTPVEQWDMSADGDGSVQSWAYIDEEATAAAGANRYKVYVAGEGGVAAHADSTHFFYVFKSLKEINGMENFHTGNVKNFYFWFGNCNELETVDLSHLDTSSATSFELFFYGCFKLKEIDASSWNTSKVTTIKNMFQRCYALETANLGGWDTSKVTNMSGLFDMNPHAGTPEYSLKSVNLSGWDTSNVTTMENMFRNCENLKELDLSSFDTSKVTTMRFMFYYCKNLKYIYAGEGWTTDAIANLNDGIFNCCYALIGQTDDQSKNEEIYADKHPSAYYPPAAEYAKFREDGGYLENASNKPQTPQYTVTYKFIGDIIPAGVTAPGEATYEEGTTVTVAGDASAEHYIFSGWSTDDATVENGEFVINNDVEFVGSWTKLYKVTYEYDDTYELPAGAPEIPDTELWFAPGEDVPVYGIPYVPEYIFVGWKTGDAEIIGDSFLMPENDVVLYGYYKKPVNSIEISGGELTVDIGGEKVKVEVIIDPPDATFDGVIYESGDESIVKVDTEGYLEPVGVGTTTITITSVDDPTKTDTVNVTVKIPVTDITVDRTNITLNKGNTDKITVTEVRPAEATNKEVTYESSDESVVKVDENGNIIAVGDGTATITVTSKDNKTVKEKVTVTVKTPVTELTVTEDFTLNVGEEKNVDAKVNEDATNKELIYEVDNPGVVKIDNDGNVIAVGEGEATITVTSKDDPSFKETVTVTVKVPVTGIEPEDKEITLTEGDKDTIKVTVTPDNATNKELTYESSDETVVKVDEKGNIEAVGEGEATITVTSKDDPTKTETVKVTVNKKIFKVTYAFVGEVIPDKVTAPAMKEYKDGTAVKVEADAAADRYIFSGWSTDDAAVANGEFVISNDVHFIGSWTKINYYNVTYKYEGDIPENAPAVPGDAEYKEGTKVTIEKAPYVEGYEFIGWSTNDTTVNEKGEFNIYNDVELVGTWRKINYYNVTYKYEGDIPENAPAVPEAKSYEENTVVTVAGVPSVDRYIFSGWTTDDTNPVDGKFNIRNDVEFIGKWTKINYYTVTYWFVGEDIPEEAELPAEKEYKEGTEVTVADVPYVEGYTFAGWTLTTDGVTITDGDFVINKNVDFIGTWTKNEVEEPTPEEPTPEEPTPEEPTPEEPTPEEPTPEEPEYVIETPEKFEIKEGLTELIYVKVTPDDGTQKPIFSSADESIAKVDEFGNVTGVKAGTTTIYVSFPNGEIRPVTVTVLAPAAPGVPSIPKTHYVCFGKTDGIGWYEVSVNGGDFFPQGPNSTLEVQEGSVLVIRTQDMWIDDEFDFYVNGDRVESVANTITVVVDGYMLIGALSMDVEVPDVDESLNLFQRIIRAIKNFFASIGDWFAKIFS